MNTDQNQLFENWENQLKESFEACILQEETSRKYKAFDHWIKPLVQELLQLQEAKTREEYECKHECHFATPNCKECRKNDKPSSKF